MFRAGMESLPVYGTIDPVWRIKLDANERSAALPVGVRRRIEKRWRETALHRYPDITANGLRLLIAESEKISIDQVLVGGGSSELIAATCEAFGGAGRPIVYPWPSFSMYPVYAALADSPPAPVQLRPGFVPNMEDLLCEAKTSAAKLIVFSNPNNPTGSATLPDEIEYLLSRAECPVLIDEAYFEYYGETVLPLLAKYKNLLVSRTFSKAMGLASALVGYLITSCDMARYIGKRLLPYHLNALSLIAAEEAYLARNLIIAEARRTAARRDGLSKKMSDMKGIEVFPSAGNFVLIRLENADELAAHLALNGIGVRNFSKTSGLRGCIRITVGNSAENEELLRSMNGFMNQ